MRTVALILSVLALIWAAPQEMTSGDLDAVIAEIFGKPKETTASIPLTPSKSSTIVPPVSPKSDDGPKRKCMTEDGESGECVHYYLCNSNNSIITDGVGVIDIRVQDDKCPSYMDVCCVLRDTRNPTDPITPAPDKLPQHEGCGWRNPDGVGFRITGDKDGESKFGEFPWMVAILKILSYNECRMTSCSNTSASKLMDQNIHSFTSYNIKMGLNCMSHIKIEPVNEDDPNGQSLNVYVGGGSLIHPSVVLTAAHYVAVSKTLRVRAGEWDTQTTKEIYPYQDRDVSSVVVHKDFNKGNLFYDIALLFLQTPMDMAPNVGVVCLPPPGVRVPGGTQCLASGWGKDKFGKEGRYQVILKKVQVPVVERRQCQNLLRKTRLGNFFELHTSFMCAGGENGVDTCKGDGGSPLVCPVEFERDRYMQSGIVAWGIGCGENGVPGVYVDVSNLRTWIDDKIKGKSLDTKVYSF